MIPPVLPPLGGPAVAQLWQQLAPHRPQVLWVGHLLLHHVEAPVWVQATEPVEPLLAAVLRALQLLGPASPAVLDGRLALGASFIERLLADLRTRGLAERAAPGTWRIREPGQASGTFQRRVFYFIERNRERPPHFLALKEGPWHPCPPHAAWQFHAGHLHACVAQSKEWKERHRFPHEVQHVLSLEVNLDEPATTESLQPWQRVVLDRAELLPVALILTRAPENAPHWLGFAIDPQQGKPAHTEHVIKLSPAAAEEALDDWLRKPTLEDWRTALIEWGRSSGMATKELQSCGLARREHHLRIVASPAVKARLQSLQGKARPPEVWLLAGRGPLRCAARLETNV